MGCFPCTKKKIAICFCIILLETIDFITDWLFYADVSHKEEGLVYGPSRFVTDVLVFNCFGTVFYLWEISNLIVYERRKAKYNYNYKTKPCHYLLNPDIVSVVVLWLEDIPQIIINVLIARCHEEPISYFQLVKASLALLDVVIKVIITLHGCCKRCRKKKTWSKTMKGVYALLIIGTTILAAAACAVFIFTQTTKDADGNINLIKPTSAMEDKYNEEKYFQSSSVFLHPPSLMLKDNQASSSGKLIRLFDIDDFVVKNLKMKHFRLTYTETSAFNLTLHQKVEVDGASGLWSLTGCYGLNSLRNGHHLLSYDKASCLRNDFFAGPVKQVFFTFRFIRPDTSTWPRKFIFGDIHYNVKVKTGRYCRMFGSTSPVVPTMADYHRLKPTTVEKAAKVYHLLPADGNRFRFYTAGEDVIPVQEAWKTGFWECPMSGRRQPLLDIGLHVPVSCD